MRPARAGWLAAALALLAVGVVVAVATSGKSPHAAASSKSDLQLIGGKPLQQASCQEWMAGSPDERAAVLAALKRSVGGPTGYGPAATLSDPDAYALFSRACARAYASGFLLYIIYSRAAAFQQAPKHFQ